MALAAHLRLTYDDYRHFPEDGVRREIIEGDLYVTPSPNTAHQQAVLQLARILADYLDEHPSGRVFIAPYDVVFSEIDIVQPDVVYIAAASADMITDNNVRGAPDLCIEVLSPATRQKDELIKKKRYESFGVKEYWLADPEARLVRVYRLSNERQFSKPQLYAAEAGNTLTSPLFPDLAIDVAKIFR